MELRKNRWTAGKILRLIIRVFLHKCGISAQAYHSLHQVFHKTFFSDYLYITASPLTAMGKLKTSQADGLCKTEGPICIFVVLEAFIQHLW